MRVSSKAKETTNIRVRIRVFEEDFSKEIRKTSSSFPGYIRSRTFHLSGANQNNYGFLCKLLKRLKFTPAKPKTKSA